MTQTWTFNPDQLATWLQAKTIAQQINQSPLFVQANIFILPEAESSDPDLSGIYVPTWDGGPAGFPEPTGQAGSDTAYWLHYRFTNGFAGMNVGLVRSEFARYPSSPLYVMGWLLQQVQQGFQG